MKTFLTYLHEAAEMQGQELTEARSKAMASFMSRAGYSEEQCCEALQQHCFKSSFIPSTAELIEIIDGDPGDQAQEQWALVLDVCRGRATKPTDGPTHKAVMAVGGWLHIGHTPIPELQWVQRRFVEAYGAFARRSAADMPQLENEGPQTALERDNVKRLSGLLRGSNGRGE